MALSAAARHRMSRPEIVDWYLRRMARRVDKENGYLSSLADEIGVHPTTISDWKSQGYIPIFQCRKLHKRFGKLAPVNDLCPAQYRTGGAE